MSTNDNTDLQKSKSLNAILKNFEKMRMGLRFMKNFEIRMIFDKKFSLSKLLFKKSKRESDEQIVLSSLKIFQLQKVYKKFKNASQH